MIRNWKSVLVAPLAALALVVGACENLSEPSQALMGPSGIAPALIETETKDGYKIVKETDTSLGVVAVIIDENGGELSLGQHKLVVPAGAVSGATTFEITKVDGDDIRVKLTATQLTTNDIGSAGFAKPVRLTLSYKNAAEMPENESELTILWVKLDGTKEAQASNVDVTGKRVSAELGHFSDYAIGFPDFIS